MGDGRNKKVFRRKIYRAVDAHKESNEKDEFLDSIAKRYRKKISMKKKDDEESSNSESDKEEEEEDDRRGERALKEADELEVGVGVGSSEGLDLEELAGIKKKKGEEDEQEDLYKKVTREIKEEKKKKIKKK